MYQILGAILFLTLTSTTTQASSRLVLCTEQSQKWSIEYVLPAPLQGIETIESQGEEHEFASTVRLIRIESNGRSHSTEDVQATDTTFVAKGKCVLLRKSTLNKLPVHVRLPGRPITKKAVVSLCEKMLSSAPLETTTYAKTEEYKQICRSKTVSTNSYQAPDQGGLQ